jgi:hypothetical protein
MTGPHSTIAKPLDQYPCVWVILSVPPKRKRFAGRRRMSVYPVIVSYGFPGQPYSNELLSRGAGTLGMAFASKEQAKQHLQASLEKSKRAEYGWRIIPVFLPKIRKMK